MAIASLKDLYLDELGDLYDAETQIIRHLPRLAEQTRAPELRETLIKHCQESRLHLERLELIFTHWSERRKSRPCAALTGIVQEADDRLKQVTADDTRDAAIVGVAQRIEHYEIAAYGCARSYARRLNRPDEARLLQETLDDEARADRRLSEIADAHINDDARGEFDARIPPARRLRYVEAATVSTGHRSREPLGIRSRGDEELGVFDGIIVDMASHRTRYVVVDGGRLLISRRYLLPITAVGYDEAADVLRVAVPKEIADRYPRFDRAEFEAMTVRELGAFESQMMDLLPRLTTPGRSEPIDSPPEWLLTGTWVTAPPERVERLSEAARAFTNEFAPDREQAVARQGPEPPSPSHDDDTVRG
jgi:ferritin-like metal-binding protein YciE